MNCLKAFDIYMKILHYFSKPINPDVLSESICVTFPYSILGEIFQKPWQKILEQSFHYLCSKDLT